MMLRWLVFAVIDWILLPVWWVSAPFLSLFTSKGWPKWGSWFWTYDNPPQGDSGWISKRSFFPNTNDKLELYCNRVGWLWRNPGYGFQKAVSIPWQEGHLVTVVGNDRISHKYQREGKYFARCTDKEGRLVAFEFYWIKKYSETRCIRFRIGYKLVTDKFAGKLRFAPLVNTINPWDGWGS